MPLKVIGGGFGRTGTMSMQKALEILGFPCYHMMIFVFREIFDFPKWIRVVSARTSQERVKHLKQIFDNNHYTATVDFPSCLYVKELLEIYPDAKVVLTLRNPEKWVNSVRETIYTPARLEFAVEKSWWGPIVKLLRAPLWRNFQDWQNEFWFKKFGRIDFDTEDGKRKAVELFDQHTKEIIELVPPQQLLIFRVEEGWEPLCKFLDVPIPSEGFPNVNDSHEFAWRILPLMYGAQFGPTLILLCVLLFYVLLRIFGG